MNFKHAIRKLALCASFATVALAKNLRKVEEQTAEEQVADVNAVTYTNLVGGTPPPNVFSSEDDEHRYIVKFKEGSSLLQERLDNARRKLSDSASTSLEDNFLIKDNVEVMILSTAEAVEEMMTLEDVEYLELDTKVYMQQTNSEQTPYGINQVKALDVSDTFVKDRMVCIIDSGYDAVHQDLPSAATGSVITGTEGGAGPWNIDKNGHGTHVAGTIAAVGGNGKGVLGVARNGELKLHIVRVFGDDGNWAWTSTLVKAVEACVDAGANVVSMSLGGGGFNQLENAAYNRIFEDENVLLVAAAGNDGNTAFSYPASYDSVMSVAAVDRFENHASFSQWNNQVDIAAPGVDVLSTLPGNTYGAYSGTSMATPHVSGVAALVWSHHTSKTAKEVRKALTDSAKDLGDPGRDDKYGFGLVQSDEAKRYLGGSVTPAPPTPPPVNSPVSSCTDVPGWTDSYGDGCAWYVDADGSNCDSYGETGGTNGQTANDACCVCGGGQTGSPPTTNAPVKPPTKAPTKNPTEAPVIFPTSPPADSPVSSCTDVPGWTDSFGDGCAWYVDADGSNCAFYGETGGTNGQTANDACCVCGGGQTGSPPTTNAPVKPPTKAPTKSPTEAPVIFPTSPPADSPVSSCTDVPGWTDSAGDGCAWYVDADGSNCAEYGGGNAGNNGQTANEACCVCEGGDAPPTTSPPPVNSPESSCTDVPGWADFYGDGCTWYDDGSTSNCDYYGEMEGTNRQTGNEACCVCGGGNNA